MRLGSGLTEDKHLDALAQERAIAALKRFSERLAGMPKEAVRVVGTNALRVARNAGPFLQRAEATLGFPIEVIPGREEARLIYLGVVHSLPLADHNRLVVDIGGGSTECIIGHKLRPKAIESLYMGCVSYTARFFPEGRIDKKSFKHAHFAAREQVQGIVARFEKTGWREAVGSSGTARSIAEVLVRNGLADARHQRRRAGMASRAARGGGRLPQALDSRVCARTACRWWRAGWRSCRACSTSCGWRR